MKNVLLIVFAFALFATGCNAEQSRPSKKDDVGDLIFLKENFNDLYKYNNKRFWDILFKETIKAKKTKSSNDFSKYLSFATSIKGNAEVYEFFAQTIEEKAREDCKLVIDSIALLTEEEKKTIDFFIRNPITMPKEEFKKLLNECK